MRTHVFRSRLTAIAAFALAAALSSCAQADGISKSGETFDAIAPTANVRLVGTEPFWSLEIEALPDKGHMAKYSDPENVTGTHFAVQRFAGNNGLGFSGDIEGKPVQATITPGECNDGMSDRVYPYTATVAMGETILFGCAYTSDEPVAGGVG